MSWETYDYEMLSAQHALRMQSYERELTRIEVQARFDEVRVDNTFRAVWAIIVLPHFVGAFTLVLQRLGG